jgi:citronellol/citronellal dehydrogenase
VNLKGKTAIITGGSRGIGKAIAIRLAKAGANIVIAAKTTEPHPKLEGTIYTAEKEIREAGGEVLAVQADVRFEDQIKNVVEQAVAKFGGVDILVNNASAISLTPIMQTEPKRYDLMQNVNVRGSFFMSQACIPYLKKSTNAHILMLSPPLDMQPKWFGPHVAYTISKFGMSMLVMGLAEELRSEKIGVNALWPRTTIATAAVENLLGGDYLVQRSRYPEIVADAAFAILTRDASGCTGNFFIDENVLAEDGITDLGKYAVNSENELVTDLFLDPPK